MIFLKKIHIHVSFYSIYRFFLKKFIYFYFLFWSSLRFPLGSWFFSRPWPLLPEHCTILILLHSHFTEPEQAPVFLAYISHHYNDNNLEIAPSANYLTVILMIYLFISCYQLHHRTQGTRMEREARTEGCWSHKPCCTKNQPCYMKLQCLSLFSLRS